MSLARHGLLFFSSPLSPAEDKRGGVVSRSLSAGAVFRGCVDRTGVILSIDETSDTVGRAGLPLRNLIAPADREQVDALLRERNWSGIVIRPVGLHTGAAAVLVAAAVRRLVDVAIVPAGEADPREIRGAGALLRALLEDDDDGIWVLDGEGGTVAADTRVVELIGSAVPGALWDHLDSDIAEGLRPEYGRAEWRLRTALQAGGPEVELTGFAIGDGGSRFGTLVRATIGPAEVGAYGRLVRTRLHDPLTGLPGRTHLLDRLAGLAGEPGTGIVALLRCAVDGFTIINDIHGTQAGNEVLVQISDRLRELALPQDYLARLGGDEFVLLRPGLGSPDEADPVAERLLAAFADPFPVGPVALEVFASIGLVTYSPERRPIDGPVLLEQADAALRSVKSDSLAGGWARHEGG